VFKNQSHYSGVQGQRLNNTEVPMAGDMNAPFRVHMTALLEYKKAHVKQILCKTNVPVTDDVKEI